MTVKTTIGHIEYLYTVVSMSQINYIILPGHTAPLCSRFLPVLTAAH